MNFFSELFSQLSKVFGSQPAARRLMVFLIMAGSIGGLVYLMLQARVGTYKTLYSNLQAADAAEAAGKLRMAEIPVRFTDNGTTIQVPTSRWDQGLMILAQEGLPGSGTPGYDELMGKSSIGVSDFELKVRYHRSLEGELARTIMTIRGVERARVHLALPKPTLFVKDTPKATASVILKLRSGETLTDKEVRGMVLLVSGAVEGLDPETVSIIDSHGDLLNDHPGSKDQPSITDRVGYKVQYENRLKDRIETMLAKTVGDGKVVARVNADFNFTQKTTTEDKFDPDSQVVRKEIVRGEGTGTEAAKSAASGAGSDPNTPAQKGTETSTETPKHDSKSKLDKETEFALSHTSSQLVETVPALQRITVSVFVDGNYDEVDDGKGGKRKEFVARDAKQMATLEEAVKSIIGYSEERAGGVGDVVTVKSVSFQANDTAGLEAVPEPKINPDLIRELVQWGIVVFIALLLIFTVLRPAVRSVSIVSPAALPAGVSGGGSAQLQHALGAAAARGLPDGAAEANEAAHKLAQANALKLESKEQLSNQLASATLSDVPKAARVIKQWLEEKK